MEEKTFISLYQRPFAEQIAFNIEQLNYRYKRLSQIDTTNKENQNEYLMLFDSFLALFRALFLEKGTNKVLANEKVIEGNEGYFIAMPSRKTADGEYEKALSEISLLETIFPNAQETTTALGLVPEINSKVEAKKKDEEMRKALGFKGVPQKMSFDIDYNKITLSKMSISKTFVFDAYGDQWFYRDADRGTKFVTSAMSVTSTAKDPRLPQLAVYKVDGDKLTYVSVLETQFARWEDYGSYLGNYHDSGNDFQKVSTVRFKVGVQVEDEILAGPFAVVVKKENALVRTTDRFANPPVSYVGLVLYPQQLSLSDFDSDKDYIMVKLFNL